MAWVRLDESFPEHPKVIEAGPIAAWLHVRAIAYCNRQLTDGFLLHAVVKSMNGTASAKVLVKVGLWKPVRGGYEIHDYLEYQPSRQDVLDRRRRRAEAGRLGGIQSGITRSKPEATTKQMLEQTRSKIEPRPRTPVPDPDRGTSSFHSEGRTRTTRGLRPLSVTAPVAVAEILRRAE